VRLVLAVGLALVLAMAATLGMALSGLPNVAASATEPGVLGWLLKTVRVRSIERRAAAIAVPDFSNRALAASGADAFDDMCAPCHGAPGREPFVGAGDMNPSPPDLAEIARERTPAELFWVVKHGVRMTGMPAWGATHSDGVLWELVAFIEQLPRLAATDYRLLAEQAERDGHGHDHAHSARALGEGGESDGHDH
jgi:mono/diheme cytochrome c family protein